MTNIVAEVSQEVEEIFQDLTGDASVSIADVEDRVSTAVDSWGQRLSEAILSETASSTAASPASVSCPSCEGQSRRHRCRGRNFTPACGVMRVRRWAYKCKCGVIHTPWEVRQGLKGQYTQRVSATMMRLSAQLNYRGAAAELKHHGIQVSFHTTLHKKVQEWSAGEDASDYVDKQSLDVGARWYVSCDGCYTNSLEGWKEVKVGCVCKDYPHTNATSVIKMRPSTPRYIASESQAVDFGRQLAALATHTGIYQDETTLETEEVVLGDGAPWIWNLADQHFPGATEIVDYMHAKSHLYDVAKQAFGEENTEAVNAWIDSTEPALYNAETSQIVAHIRTLGTQNPAITDTVEIQVRYFQKHSQRMQYRTLNEKGYQIGSGVIEAACKHVVAQRCKQAGMRWTKTGIEAIRFWRCLLKNDACQTYWNTQNTETPSKLCQKLYTPVYCRP